jgi:hypothetical protein
MVFNSTRLRNIAETEKAKRQVAEERKEHKKANNDEEHLVATRCMYLSCHIDMASDSLRPVYRPHLKQKTDAEIMRDAKLEARGMRPREDRRPRNDRPQMATDEVVCVTLRRSLFLAHQGIIGHGTVQEEDAKMTRAHRHTIFSLLYNPRMRSFCKPEGSRQGCLNSLLHCRCCEESMEDRSSVLEASTVVMSNPYRVMPLPATAILLNENRYFPFC